MAQILLIDHEPYRIQSLARGLRIVGHHPFEARTRLEAMACIRRPGVHIDLIITDCSTRTLCDPELLQTVLERFPDVRVVIMTDKTKWNQEVDTLPWPTHFLDKPFTDGDLIHLVETLLTRGNHHDASESVF